MSEQREQFTARELVENTAYATMEEAYESGYREGYYAGWRVAASRHTYISDREFDRLEAMLFEWMKGDASKFELPPV